MPRFKHARSQTTVKSKLMDALCILYLCLIGGEPLVRDYNKFLNFLYIYISINLYAVHLPVCTAVVSLVRHV